MSVAIKTINISKAYQLGQIGTGTISRDIERWVAKVRGKEDPFLKIGETNDRTQKGSSNIVWSLRDINFEIQQGDAVGIIGRNGAGKSTLLKLLSRVTAPTTGNIKVKGRIASLLEVGTGFHPELTGRENIFLNGAILGMRKKEITKKLDQIIDFSGCERYIDTPVKRYSSGMYVRLAFAVAAHLESEILVVDEVLAVGDAEFQKKCLGKMGEVSKGEGRTVLFVSHNMQAINTLCNKGILLKNGKIEYNGHVEECLKVYLASMDKSLNASEINNTINQLPEDECLKLISINILQDNEGAEELLCNKKIEINYLYEIKKAVIGFRLGFDLIETSSDAVVFRSYHDDESNEMQEVTPGVYTSKVIIPENLLKKGNYILNIISGIHNVRWIINGEIKIQLNMNNFGGVNNAYADERPGVIMPKLTWNNVVEINN